MSKLEMYKKAAKAINAKGNYKGYTGANALSLYVNDKFGVNAAADNNAHDALCEAMSLLNDNEQVRKMRKVINLQGFVWTESYARDYYGNRFDSMIANNLLAYA